MKKSTVFIQLSIFIGIIVVLNLISQRLFLRLDFTEDKRYTLSDATKNVLNEIDDVITINAYFTQDLPSQLTTNRKDFEDLLVEYEKRSGGNVIYKFINPNESQEMETEAQQAGINPIIVNVTESDQVQQLRAYMGAVIQKGESSEIIPLVQPGSSMEYDLTTSIKKITVQDKPKVGFISGHGEPSIQASGQLAQQLAVLYDIEPVNLDQMDNIPTYYQALAWINPTDSISTEHFNKLDQYLANGGGVYLAFSPLDGDLNSGSLQAKPQIGLVNWLGSKGINMESQYIIDANCASIGVRQQQGPFVFNTQVQLPYFPIIGSFEDHPISKGIESLILQFTNPISYVGDTSTSFTPLAFSSENSGLVSPPAFIDINRKWELSDFDASELVVSAALENKKEASRLILVSNGTFAVNGEGQQAQQVNRDNVNFAANAIDWLADDTGLVDLRTKGVTNRPIKQLEDGEKNLVKYGNVVLPIILILIYAFARRQRNLKKRSRWQQGNY